MFHLILFPFFPSNLGFLPFKFGRISTPLGLAWWYWLGTLECAPLKVSGLIPPSANFGGLVHIGLCSSMKRGPQSHKWTVGLDPKISQSLGRMPSFQTKSAESDRTNFIYSITYISKQSNGNFFSIKFHQALDIQTQPYCHYFLWLLTASCFFFFLLCLCQVPSLCKSLLM